MMLLKENVKEVVRKLAGRCRMRMLDRHNDSMFEFKETNLSKLQNRDVAYIFVDNADMYSFVLTYDIIKKRRVTMRDIVPGSIVKYKVQAGRFQPEDVEHLVDSIPDNGVISKIEFIHGHAIYREPAQYRRPITIGSFVLYVDQCSNQMTHVVLTDDSCIIQRVNRSTGVYYEPLFYRPRAENHGANKRVSFLKRKTYEFKRGHYNPESSTSLRVGVTHGSTRDVQSK